MAKDEEKKKLKEKEAGSGGEGEAAESKTPQKSSKKKLLIIGGICFLLLTLGLPVIFLLSRGGPKMETAGGEAAESYGETKAGSLVAEGSDVEEELGENEEALGAIFPLDTFVVNLQGGRYLRCQVQFEFVEREVPKRFYARMVPARDALVMLLTSKKAEDLGTPEGKELLKREIKDLVNEVLKKEDVKNVYFTQFVVQ